MRLQSLTYEGFYKDPIAIRNKVLEHEFYPPNYLDNIPRTEGLDSDLVYEISKIGNFCGVRTIRVEAILPELNEYTNDIIKKVCNLPFKLQIESYFTLQTINDEINKSIHQDNAPILAGIVYLTPNPAPNSGTVFYKHKVTGWHGLNQEKIPNMAIEDMQPTTRENQIISNFEEYGSIANCFNRMILYDSNVLHRPGNFFGNNKITGRLTQAIFVYKSM